MQRVKFQRSLFSLTAAVSLASCASGVTDTAKAIPGSGFSKPPISFSDVRYNIQIPPPANKSLYVSGANVDSVIDPRLSPGDKAVIRQKLLLIPPAWRGAGLIYRSMNGRLYASSLELLKMERSKQRAAQHSVATPGESVSRPLGALVPNACPQWNLDGHGTGPFRRVYIGCDGYNTQIINFDDGPAVDGYIGGDGCHISDTINQANDLHDILAGAYPTGGGGGIDAGLVFVNGSKPYWEPYMVYNHMPQIGNGYGCNGSFNIDLTLQAGSGGENDFVLATSFTDKNGGNHTDASIMQGVPASTFPTSGVGFIFRRLTSIGQVTQNLQSGEWFGFAPNAGVGGPNLSSPEILFTSTTVSGGKNGPTQVQFNYNTNSYGERYPAVYNQMTGVICSNGPTPPWYPIDFNSFEGINLDNSNASGTMPNTPCAQGQ